MKYVREIQTYRANRTRVSARDINNIVDRLEFLERMVAVSPLTIDHVNNTPVISLSYTPAVIYRLKLAQDLPRGGSALAKRVVWGVREEKLIVDENDKLVTAFDLLSIHPGLEEDNCYALASPGSNKYEVISIQHIAHWIRFKLNEDLTTSMDKAQAIVMDYWQGYSPEQRFAGDFEVWNIPATNTPYIFFGESAGQGGGTSGSSGDIGLACWDEVEKLYKIVNIECA